MSISTTALLIRESRVELLKALRTPEYALPTLLLPVLFFGLFGFALSRDGSAAPSMTATYGIFAALGPALFGLGAGLATEREQGLLALKRISPLPTVIYPLAKLISTGAMVLLSLGAIYLMAAMGGVRFGADRWVLMAGVHLLAVLPFALMGVILGAALSSQGAIALANILFFPLCILGGLWFPVHVFPAWLAGISPFLPSYHLAELALIAAGQPRPQAALVHGGLLLVMTAVLAGLAGLAVRRSRM